MIPRGEETDMPSSNRTLLLEDLAVPYVVRVTAVKEPGGWLRRAEYPELWLLRRVVQRARSAGGPP